MTEDKQRPTDLLNDRRVVMLDERILVARMQTDAIAGELIDRKAAVTGVEDIVGNARQRLFTMPGRIAAILADLLHTETEVILPVLRSESLAILEELRISELEAADAATRAVMEGAAAAEGMNDGLSAGSSRKPARQAPRNKPVGQDDRGPDTGQNGSATPAKRAVRNIKSRRAAATARRRKRPPQSSS